MTRPIIFFMFGGSFISGTRVSPDIVALCTKYAQRGYVAVAIDYRLSLDLILNAISGYKGLYLSEKILKNKIDIALSNKESIVQAGEILSKSAKKNNTNIFPVDSEHSAIHQCISRLDNLFCAS